MLALKCALLSISLTKVSAFLFVYSDQNGAGSQCSPLASLSAYGCPCPHPGAPCQDPGTICSLADENGYLKIQNPSAAFILLMVNELKCLCVAPWEKSEVLNKCVNDAVVSTTPDACINAEKTTIGTASTTTGTTASATSTTTGTTATVTNIGTVAWTTTSKPTTTEPSTETNTGTTTTITSAESSTSAAAFQVILTPTNAGATANLDVMKCYPQKNFTVATLNITGGTAPYVMSGFHSNNDCYRLDGQTYIIFEGGKFTYASSFYPCWTGDSQFFMTGQNDTVDLTVQDSSVPPQFSVVQLKV